MDKALIPNLAKILYSAGTECFDHQVFDETGDVVVSNFEWTKCSF